jgi:hypothetical protein
MNWGKWIIVSFVLFAVFIGTLVVVCVRQDINLVSKNYYAEELNYEQQIERINNTARLDEKPRIRVVDHAIEVQFNQFNKVDKGEIKLVRPSDVKLDRLFTLHAFGDTAQQFDVSTLPGGMYRVKMLWSMNGKEYYVEDMITL